MFNYYDDRLQHTYDPSQNAHDLTVPVIAVNSFDDPFSPPDGTTYLTHTTLILNYNNNIMSMNEC